MLHRIVLLALALALGACASNNPTLERHPALDNRWPPPRAVQPPQEVEQALRDAYAEAKPSLDAANSARSDEESNSLYRAWYIEVIERFNSRHAPSGWTLHVRDDTANPQPFGCHFKCNCTQWGLLRTGDPKGWTVAMSEQSTVFPDICR